MAATDATSYPVRGQAYRISGAIFDVTTCQIITGGLTTLAATASADGAAFSATGVTVTEIGTTGWFTVDLTDDVMTADTVLVHVTEGTANSTDFGTVINPLNMAEITGRPDAATILRPEKWWVQCFAYLANKITRNKNTGAMTWYQNDDSTSIATATDSDDGTTVTKGQFS